MKKQNSFLRELASFLITLLLITFLAFSLLYLAPSDPAEIQLARTGIAYTPEELASLRKELGLADPFWLQYLRWLRNLLLGDLGLSMSTRLPVADCLLAALPNTLLLALATLTVSACFSLLFGIFCAVYQDTFFDRSILALSNALAALPGYFISLLLLYFFALRLRIFSVLTLQANLKNLILPAVALSFGLIPLYIRQIRAAFCTELAKPYITGVRSRGVHNYRIFFCHALKNCASPLLNMAGISLSTLLGGSIIVESIFGWPGLGLLAMEAVTKRDYTLLQGYIVFVAIAYFFLNSLIDFLSLKLDPRQRLPEVMNNDK